MSQGTFGLFSIRERIEHLGGSMRVESGDGRGTVVTLTVPLGSLPDGDRSGSC